MPSSLIKQTGPPVPPVILAVVQQHADESMLLHETRKVLIVAPHVQLFHLRRADDRLAAHLDGLSVAGETAWPICRQALETPTASSAFVATVRALEERREDWLNESFELVGSSPEAHDGLVSAFSWLEREKLRGVVADLLRTDEPGRRLAGVAASAVHRVDPGIVPARRLEDADSLVRARSIRAAGELGLRALVSAIAGAIADEDPACRFWAAWSAVLLGDRHKALEFLKAAGTAGDSSQQRALQLATLAMPLDENHEMLRQIADDPARLRTLIRGAGFAGDPSYIPWLIRHMSDDKLGRLAGESFSMITGLDLSRPPFYRERPENIESGPTEDPEDENVEMDDDDDLPWPDQARLQAWWNQNGSRFTTGVRHFMGAPPSRAHCLDVLKEGYQRQRIVAAFHLCLLNPGTPLFEWRAPAWRQQRELAQMS
jgi:uncharacterized protein (TIGR02270 family)